MFTKCIPNLSLLMDFICAYLISALNFFFRQITASSKRAWRPAISIFAYRKWWRNTGNKCRRRAALHPTRPWREPLAQKLPSYSGPQQSDGGRTAAKGGSCRQRRCVLHWFDEFLTLCFLHIWCVKNTKQILSGDTLIDSMNVTVKGHIAAAADVCIALIWRIV